MPVKDLIRQYESSPPDYEGPSTPNRIRRHSALPVDSCSTSPSTPGSAPSPSPARFIHHPLLKRQSLPMSPATPLPFRPRHSPRTRDAQAVPQKSTVNVESKNGNSTVEPQAAAFIRENTGAAHSSGVRVEDHSERLGSGSTLETARNVASPSSQFTYFTQGAKRRSTIDATMSHKLPGSSMVRPLLLSEMTQGDDGFPDLTSSRSAPDEAEVLCVGQGSRQVRDMSLPASPFGQGSWVVGMNASMDDQANLHSIPSAYSAFQEGVSMKRSARIPSPTWSPQVTTLGDIPLDKLSRNTHDNDDHDDLMNSRPPSPSTTLVSQPIFNSHVPIAAKTVFSRGSAPLSLPALDDYLASFPAPTFTSFPSRRSSVNKGKQRDTGLFPPMDLLVAAGHSVEDLEKNSTIQPWWRNRGSIFSSLVNVVIGVMGSSALATYYSLQGLYDGFQLFALLLSTVVPNAGKDTDDKWRKLFLGTIPNVLALNLSYTLVESFILLIVLMALSGLLLYYFHISTTRIALASAREGLQGKDTSAGWGVVFASFVLTLIYLPLSTIAVHALLWSEDFWAVSNPYTNAAVFPPTLPQLGPSSQFRDPLDFCYTTTMNKNEINFAPVVVILSALTFTLLTVWFPIRLINVIKGAVPHVDQYTELGKHRSRVELDHEYERLLDRDKNPFNFLYKDLRMGWGTYKSSYLFVKLSTLLIVAVLDSNNCLFRNASRTTVPIVRQAVLVFAMSSFLLIQSILAPFLDHVNNASEWISRAGYVAFAVLGLVAALNLSVGVKDALNGPILYMIYIINYGFTFYFLFINLSWTHRLVKRLSHRIDFSIDIFSPHLDISRTSHHTRRRIWQETISVLLLTSHECAIPKSQKMGFSESENSQWPPYLLGFQGTPAERHVENLKILREVGGLEYAKGVALHTGRYSERMKTTQEKIQRHYVGPDSYWKTPSRHEVRDSCFGNAWWIPFPPTLVMRYDSGELVVLNKLHELEHYVHQNEDLTVHDKRSIRMALRALDGLVVMWPYTHTQSIGARSLWCWGRRYKAQTAVKYESGVFSIKRHGSLAWKGVELGSGFDVQLNYARDVQLDGGTIGLDTDFDLTPQLARFLALNKGLVHDRLQHIDFAIYDYRRRMRRNARAKCDSLTYDFLSTIYCSPREPHRLAQILSEQEKDIRVRQAFAENEGALVAGNERMAFVNQSEASAWWYLYWDDLWRRNYDTIAALNTHASDFNPHYSTSIAYRLLPRVALETFLAQRGLFNKNGGRAGFIHSGVLNKLYFRLNQIVFRGSDKAIAYHLGDNAFAVDLEDLEFSSHAKSSTLGTGGGTDHDDISIRARPLYRWEAIFEDPLQHGTKRYKRWLPKLAVWFGLSPFWNWSTAVTSGVSLDVRLEDGRYVLLENAVEELKEKVV